jgi:hypothetical protein
VLAKYQIMSEPVRSITAITTKQERFFINSLGSFRYYSIPDKLFCGYKIKTWRDKTIAEATKAKALFDFLYLRFRREKNIDIESLRLNLESMNKKDWQEFFKYFDKLKSKKWEKFKLDLKKYAKR